MADEWPYVALRDVADVLTGYPFKSAFYVNDGDAPRLLRGDNVAQGVIRWNGVKRWGPNPSGKIDPYWLREGDVVLAMDRPWIEAGLKFASIRELDLPALLVQRVARLRGSDRLLGRFLHYVVASRQFTDYVVSVQTGTAVPHISRNQIGEYEFILPSFPEQRTIARILGTLDDKIELNRRMNETLEAMARSLFKDWFVDYGPVRAKAEGRDPGLPQSLADLFPARVVDSDLGEIPEGWPVESLADRFEAVKGVSYKGSGLGAGGVPLHNLNSIHEGGGYKYEGIKYYSGEHAERHVVLPGDVIVANTEQGHERLLIGYAAVVPSVYGNYGIASHHIYRVRPRPGSRLKASYLCFLLNSPQMHDLVSGFANGTTVNMLPLDALQKPPIVCPPGPLVEEFGALAVNARQRCEELLLESRTLASLRDLLLPKLISGEIRLRDAEKAVEAVA